MRMNAPHDDPHNISVHHHDIIDRQFEQIINYIDDGNLNEAVELLLSLHYADLADFLDNRSHRDYPVIFPAIASKLIPDVLVCLSDSNKQPAIEALGIEASAKLINELDIEDSIEVIDALNPEFKELIIAELNAEKRQQIIEGFRYPEDTVGRILEKDFVSLKRHWTAGQAVDYIRRSNITADFYAAIIVDNRFKPVGIVLLSTILKSARNTPISELMNDNFMVADTGMKVNELVFIFKQYALTIVPVINKQGKLVGSISIDNMIYIIEEQTESELLYLGGINNSDIFYNLYVTAKSRFPWLFVNLITACLTSLVINQFNNTIAKLITLATIMPIVASIGGNAGTQAMTITVRALGNREINSSNTVRVITKEVYICLLNGLILSLIGLVLIYFLFGDLSLSIIFALSILINFAISGFLGTFIPIMLNQFNIDPAAASGVVLTVFTDAIGFFSFLGLAYFFLV